MFGRAIRFWILASIAVKVLLLLTGCGGGGGGEGDVARERPTHTADGYGVDAVIADATIQVFSWQDGVKGELLGQGRTDADGYYSISLQAPNQPVLLELSGGYYTEEASDRRVNLAADQRLFAATYYSGDDLTVMVTPITSLAAGLAEYLVANEGYNAENAITFATSAMTGIYGFNCLETYPINITYDDSVTATLTDGHLYGFFAAAMSSWTAAISEANGQTIHSTYNSVYLAQLMYNDIVCDGALDGIGLNSRGEPLPLYMGTVALNSRAYRQMIGHHLILAADAEYNATGLGVNDIIEEAGIYSQRVNDVFANEAPLALDAEGPKVYQSSSEPLGKYYTGQIDYRFVIEDLVGIADMQVDIDGDILDAQVPTDTRAEVTVTIDTTAYPDGNHTLTVVSTDQLNNTSAHTLKLYSNNTGVTITEITSAALTRATPLSITGTYQESQGTSLTEITVNGHVATVDSVNHTWSYSLALAPGTNEVVIAATDNLGTVTSITTTVDLDGLEPVIYTGDNHGTHRFYIGEGETVGKILHDETNAEDMPLYYDYYNTSLDGIAVTRVDLLGAEIPFFRFILSDPDDNGVSTPVEDMVVTMTYRRHGDIITEMQLNPVADTTDEYIIPLVTEYLGTFYNCSEDDIHTITVETADAAGNPTTKIFTFKAYVDTPEMTVGSLNSTANVSVYDWATGTKGALIATGRTDQAGSAVIKLFASATPVLVEVTEGRYKEFVSGIQVAMTDGQVLQGVTDFLAQDLVVMVTPLTHVAAALAKRHAGQGMTAQEAMTAANETISSIYGVDIISTPIINIADSTYATSVCSDPYRHAFILAGLSGWAYEAANANGAYSQTYYNSVLLASRMAEDIAKDGMLNGATFGAVTLNTAVYQNEFGAAILAAIESGMNMSQLDAGDYLKFAVDADTTPADATLNGVTFATRSNLYGQRIVLHESVITNDDSQPKLFKIDGKGGDGTCVHEYFDGHRRAMVREILDYHYRARYAMDDSEYHEDFDYRWSEWQTVSAYDTYENGRWATHALPTGYTEEYYTENDVLPADIDEDWGYLISEAGGSLAQINQRCWPGPGSNCYTAQAVFADFRIGSGRYAYVRVVNNLRDDSCEHDDFCFDDMTDNWSNITIRPQIQRTIRHTFEYIDGPTVDIEDHVQNYAITARINVLNTDGSAVQTVGGYYILPGQQSAVVTKEIVFPDLPVYSGGEPGRTPDTFDKAVTFTINKDIGYSVSRNSDPALVVQSPHYQYAYQATLTNTVSR